MERHSEVVATIVWPMDIRCRRCREAIPASDINLDRMMAKCAACSAVFDFSDQISQTERREPEISTALAKQPAPIQLPNGWKLERRDGTAMDATFGYRANAPAPVQEFVLSWRWFSPLKHLFMLVFAVGWNAFLLFWYTSAAGGDAPWLFYVFPLVHVAVGIGIGYGALAGVFNRTTITIERDTLSVRHGPLPWLGNREISKQDLQQLFCREKVAQRRGNNSHGGTISYEVHAQLGDSEVKLIGGLSDARQAMYIEQLFETTLGIKDVRVAGELPK